MDTNAWAFARRDITVRSTSPTGSSVVRVITERYEREASLTQSARYDSLTGEFNRGYLFEMLTATLDGLGTGAVMSRATAERQRQIGALALTRPPAGLAAKLDLILLQTAGSHRERAA